MLLKSGDMLIIKATGFSRMSFSYSVDKALQYQTAPEGAITEPKSPCLLQVRSIQNVLAYICMHDAIEDLLTHSGISFG